MITTAGTSSMGIQGITETDIANYLANSPGFFERHAELLASVQLSHPHGQRAVSLQERQAEMLREKIKGLEFKIIEVAVLSMGNPHAVTTVASVDSAPVESLGPSIERDPRFRNGVNVGFMEVVARDRIRLRVFERGAGETLACGTGPCAAVVAGIRLGLLDHRVEVEARGGTLTIEWPGGAAPVLMTGPATTVFEGEIEL